MLLVWFVLDSSLSACRSARGTDAACRGHILTFGRDIRLKACACGSCPCDCLRALRSGALWLLPRRTLLFMNSFSSSSSSSTCCSWIGVEGVMLRSCVVVRVTRHLRVLTRRLRASGAVQARSSLTFKCTTRARFGVIAGPQEASCPRSYSCCRHCVSAWCLGTSASVTRVLIDQSTWLVELVSARVCPAAGTPAPRLWPPLTTLCRGASWKVLLSLCSLSAVSDLCALGRSSSSSCPEDRSEHLLLDRPPPRT